MISCSGQRLRDRFRTPFPAASRWRLNVSRGLLSVEVQGWMRLADADQVGRIGAIATFGPAVRASSGFAVEPQPALLALGA